MANRLKMARVQSILSLHAQGWSQRRIARELGIDRETVSRYVRAGQRPAARRELDGRRFKTRQCRRLPGPGLPADSKPANAPIPGPGIVRWSSRPWRRSSSSGAGRQKRLRAVARVHFGQAATQGLSAERIHQDLRASSCPQSVTTACGVSCADSAGSRPLPFRRMECAPGEEAQVDFGNGRADR